MKARHDLALDSIPYRAGRPRQVGGVRPRSGPTSPPSGPVKSRLGNQQDLGRSTIRECSSVGYDEHRLCARSINSLLGLSYRPSARVTGGKEMGFYYSRSVQWSRDNEL